MIRLALPSSRERTALRKLASARIPRPPQRTAFEWGSLRAQLFDVRDISSVRLMHQANAWSGYRAWYVREGSIQLNSPERPLDARRGQWLVSADETAQAWFAPGTRALLIQFRCDWPNGDNLFAVQGGLVFDAEAYPALERAAATLAGLALSASPPLSERVTQLSDYLRLQDRFLQWLREFYETMLALRQPLQGVYAKDERLRRAVDLLEGLALDARFPARELQRRTGLGRAQLDRLFSKEFAVSSREYWNRRREQEAIRYLSSTSFTVKEISYRIGFKHPSNFAKWFLQRVGRYPSEFRPAYRFHFHPETTTM